MQVVLLYFFNAGRRNTNLIFGYFIHKNKKVRAVHKLASFHFKYLSVGTALPFRQSKIKLSVSVLHLFKACAAINRSVVRGLEYNLCLSSALSAYSREVFTGCSSCVLLSIAACLTSLGLGHKALLLIKYLLARRENELVSSILAYKCLVNKLLVLHTDFYFFVHVIPRFVF